LNKHTCILCEIDIQSNQARTHTKTTTPTYRSTKRPPGPRTSHRMPLALLDRFPSIFGKYHMCTLATTTIQSGLNTWFGSRVSTQRCFFHQQPNCRGWRCCILVIPSGHNCILRRQQHPIQSGSSPDFRSCGAAVARVIPVMRTSTRSSVQIGSASSIQRSM
jgi:hypothetical protein